EDEVEVTDLFDARFFFVEQSVDARADLFGEWIAAEADLFDSRAGRVAGDAHDHRVDGVDRGSRHQPDDDALFFLRDFDEPLQAVHVSSTSRMLRSSSSRLASAAPIFFLAMIVASRTLPSASRNACTAIGRVTPAASSIIRTARLRNFSFVAGMSIIRFE